MTMKTFSYFIEYDKFDADKLKARYKLDDSDFKVVTVNGMTWVHFKEEPFRKKLRQGNPVFDTPDRKPAVEMKTKHDYAIEIVEMLAPSLSLADQQRICDKLLRLTGELPPEVKK